MTNTVIQEWTDEKGWIHRIEIPLTTFLIEHNLDVVKHGHWTYERLTDTNGGSYSVVRCSNCQARVPWVTKYCSYCGAKMDEVEDGDISSKL